MKKISILLLLVITVTFTFAQKALSTDYDYKVSKPYKVVDARSKEYFSNGKEVLGVKIKANKNQVLLQKYNIDNMSEIGKKTYNDLPKNFLYEGLVQAQGKYYFFYSSWSGKKTKHERLYYREIDFENGTFKGESKQVIDHQGKLAEFYVSNKMDRAIAMSAFGNYSYGKMFNAMFAGLPKFKISTSTNESKILIQYRKKPKVKKDTKSWDIIGYKVYDTEMNETWAKTYTMPYTERRMNILDNLIDQNGKVYMLAKVFHDDSNRDKKRRRDKSANYHIELFEITDTADKIKTSKISLDDKFINDIVLVQSKEDELLCSGFYNKGRTKNSSDGLFTYKIDLNGKLISKNHYEIPLGIINQYVKNRTKKKNARKDKKGKAEINALALKNIITNGDGSITLVGEKSYVVEHRNYKTGKVTYTFHYEDVLISKINANGELAWMKKIPKRQKGVIGKGGLSYSYFNANGNHYLIYLDNVKNFDLPLNKRPAMHMDGKGGYLTAVKINDQTGELVKGSILDFRRIKGDIVAYQFNTDRIVKTKDNEFFVEVYKKKKEDIFLRVEMK